MALHVNITRRRILKAATASAVAAPAVVAFKPTSALLADPIVDTLEEHRRSLDAEDGAWIIIENQVSSKTPILQTRDGALECLRTALRIDNMGSFETSLIKAALTYFEERIAP